MRNNLNNFSVPMMMLKGEKYETTSLALYRLYCFPNQISRWNSEKWFFLITPRWKSSTKLSARVSVRKVRRKLVGNCLQNQPLECLQRAWEKNWKEIWIIEFIASNIAFSFVSFIIMRCYSILFQTRIFFWFNDNETSTTKNGKNKSR